MKWGRGEEETDRRPPTHKSKALSPWSPSKRQLLGAQERRFSPGLCSRVAAPRGDMRPSLQWKGQPGSPRPAGPALSE